VKLSRRWTRSAAVLAATAPLALAATTASAAPLRTADTTDYTTASYLHDVLRLPAADADPAIDTITYSHLHWLLQQPGQYAVLIGDPATDAGFVARAQDVEAAARAAGVDTVYWFNPNLSGSASVAGVEQPALDIRDPSSITSLTANSQRIYGHAWKNLVARSLGNGVTWSGTGLGGSGPTVTTETQRPEAVNDSGATAGQSTEVGNPGGGALYDYSATDTPADVTDSYFLVYDKDGVRGGGPQKIVSWVDLTEKTDASATRADVATAIAAVGGSALDAPAQFEWWKADVNERASRTTNPNNGDIPVLTAADADWRVEQITYPELIHLLDSDATADADAVILFGGAWCPNTRPVLPAINRYAQDNDVHVFNFDTVLDGANVAGGATSGVNPLQSRNNHGSGAHPSFLYGHLFDHYLGNASTEYVPSRNGITYYPGGDTASTPVLTRRLQVPYLIGYQGNAGDGPHGGVTRQWIEDKGDGTFAEYMSEWQYVNPLPNRIGLTIPSDAQIWSTLNDQLARFTWQTDPATVYPNAGVWTDAGQYLGAADGATVTYNPPTGSATTGTLTVSSGGTGTTGVSPAALSAALSALGGSAPASLAAARTALIAANEPAADQALIDNLKVVVGAWRLAEVRKENVTRAWGTVADASGVVGGLRAVHAAEVFFGGLPGGVVSTQTVTADAVKQGTAPKIAIAITNEYGRVPTGAVSLVVKHGGTTVVSDSKAVADGAVTFTLPALAAGTYEYTLSYQGDEQIAAFAKSGSLTVSPADQVPGVRDPDPKPPVVVPPPAVVTPPVVPPPAVVRPPVVTKPTVRRVKARRLAGAVAKAPTRAKAGSYKVTITAPRGGAKATGTVKITLKKGRVAKTVSGRLVRGTVTLKLPKLASGTWKVAISWSGDSRYLAARSTGAAIKVK
jgi:hypothetical protein